MRSLHFIQFFTFKNVTYVEKTNTLNVLLYLYVFYPNIQNYSVQLYEMFLTSCMSKENGFNSSKHSLTTPKMLFLSQF